MSVIDWRKKCFKRRTVTKHHRPPLPCRGERRTPVDCRWNSPLTRQSSEQDRYRRSSASSTSSSLQSPRSSLDAITTPPARPTGPLRAFAADPPATTKPRLGIDRKGPSTSTTPVLLRLGSINQQDLLKKYSSLNTATPPNPTTTPKPGKSTESSSAPINSADKFRRMVLDCRELSS